MTYADREVAKARDRERFKKRSAERVAQGLCPRCGERSPEPGRALCAGCAEKRNRAGRARDARLREEGKPRRDPIKAREYERERARREREERRDKAICIRCGERPAAPDRASCEPCLEKRREADRAKYAAGKAAGLPYGGADPDARKKYARARSTVRRLKTMPGVGPMTALAVEAFAPDMSCFRRGRDFSAWLGLVPKQHSTGGKDRLGRVSKRGQKDIRSLLIIGAMSVIQAAERVDIRQGCWLARMLTRKPRMVVAIALANKMARGVWAMPSKGQDYRSPAAA